MIRLLTVLYFEACNSEYQEENEDDVCIESRKSSSATGIRVH